jgi:tol-pal system protein YbgF
MQPRIHGVVFAALLAFASGCASVPVSTEHESADADELKALRVGQEQQLRRIGELEARLALLEADARRARDDGGSTLRTGETVRITSESAPARAPSQELADTEPPSDLAESEGKRPSLRLYGSERTTAPTSRTAASLPAVPVVTERLPVVPLPEQRAAKALREETPPAGDQALVQYRKALRSLRERSFDSAIETFSRFVDDNPTHELLPSALYWRGEAHYAKRDYAAARREFDAMMARFPEAEHAPDALFKLGLALQKLGHVAQAKQAFQRLRTDYPNSQAAQTAAREGST